MSGAKWACFLGLPTISSYILLYFVKSIYNPWNRLFFSSCPLFFTRLYTYTCFFDVCFCFLGTGGFRTQIRSARFYRFFVLFVCFSIFSSLTFSLHNIHDWPVFSRWHASAIAHVRHFPTVSLCISQRETSINIWSIRQCEACSLVCSPWREVVYAVCFGWSTSLKLTTLPLMDALFWPVTHAKTPCWSISSKLRLQASSLITHTCRNVLAQLLTNLTVVRACTCANRHSQRKPSE